MKSCAHAKPDGEMRCATCKRIESICRSATRAQNRLNADKPLGTLGERIAAGNA